MTRTVRVMQKKLGQDPKVTMMKTDTETMREFVGGHTDSVQLGQNVVAVINDEGLLHDLEPNVDIDGNVLVGDLFFVGMGMVDGEFDFLDLSDQQIDIIKQNVNFSTELKAPKPHLEFHEFDTFVEMLNFAKKYNKGE